MKRNECRDDELHGLFFREVAAAATPMVHPEEKEKKKKQLASKSRPVQDMAPRKCASFWRSADIRAHENDMDI